jgi:CRP-like cAMP-binding protein
VIAADAAVRWVYLVQSGQITNEQTSTGVVAPTVGTFIGDLAAFAGCESPLSITAISDLEAFAISTRDFAALCDSTAVVRAALRATLRATLRPHEQNNAH